MNNRRQRMPTGEMIALAEYMHSTPTQMIYKALINDLVPMFNQEVYNSNQNGQVIGKIDEIMGQTANYMFTVIPAQGINSKNMKEGDKIYLDRAFFLPMTRAVAGCLLRLVACAVFTRRQAGGHGGCSACEGQAQAAGRHDAASVFGCLPRGQ